AYDLAEAMMAERARRIDGDEGRAIAGEPAGAGAVPSVPRVLLDEPVLEPDPGYDDDLDPSWLEPPYDPSWDLETRWSADPQASPSRPPGPGLARTTPDQAGGEEKKERTG